MENIFVTSKDILSPENLIVVFANVFAFITLETIFFWFIASGSVNKVIDDKADLLYTFSVQDSKNKEALKEYLNSSFNTDIVPEKAKEQKEERENNNWNLVNSYITPIAIGVAVLFIVAGMLMFIRKQPLTRIDKVLLLSVLGAFTTELYFYFTVTSQLVYIGDNEMMNSIYRSSQKAVSGG